MLTSALGTMIGIDLLFCVTDRLSSFSTTIVFSRAQSDFTLLWPREEALLSFFFADVACTSDLLVYQKHEYKGSFIRKRKKKSN